MPNFIIHHDGVYNYYTTVADGACYEGGLTLAQVEEIERFERGEQGLRELPRRLERAHKTGCSGMGWSLHTCIQSTREPIMARDEFISRYLTLPSSGEGGVDGG